MDGTNKIYLNGELQGTFKINSDFVERGIVGSDDVFKSAFIIGQEPDPPSPSGGFEAEQVFIGDITELNVWNYSLNDKVINKMGVCKTFEKGNVISWLKEKFKVNNA